MTRMLALLAFLALPAGAAELDGVRLPDTWSLGDRTLRLNGIGTRVYSIFRVRVYVAGLYLERPQRDPAAILASSDPKVVQVHVLHPVSRDDQVKVWRDSLEQSCRPPCRLDPAVAERFYDLVRDVEKGTTTTYAISQGGLEIGYDGKSVGRIDDPAFARLVLATFIGDHPPTPELKRALLGG